MSVSVIAFADSLPQARALAEALAVPCSIMSVHKFPDGESKVVAPSSTATVLLFRSLHDPNAKLLELLLAVSALRDIGTQRVILVSPYLAYMRQDIAFHEGEAVSQRVVGRLLAGHFDGLVTVDPHLHRITKLSDAIPEIPAINVSAAPAIIDTLACEGADDVLFVGPDAESRPWVERIAQPLGAKLLIGEKQRLGDSDVRLSIPNSRIAARKRVILIDDIVSSGATLLECAKLLQAAGAARVEAIVSHCLASAADIKKFGSHGLDEVRATDSVPGPNARISLASTLANAIRQTMLI